MWPHIPQPQQPAPLGSSSQLRVAPRSSLLHSQRCSKCSYSPPASAPSCQQHKRTPAVLRTPDYAASPDTPDTPDYAASGRAAELIPDLSYICRNLNFYFIHNSQIYLNFSHADFKMQSAKDLKAVSYRLKKQSAKDLKSSQKKT